MTPRGLRDRFARLGQHQAAREVVAALRRRGACLQQISGLSQVACAAHAVILRLEAGRPLLVVTGSQADAESLHEAVTAWFEMVAAEESDFAPCLLPAHDVTPFDGLSPHPDIAQSRAIALWRMAQRRVSILVTPIAAALQRVAPPDSYRRLAWQVRVGGEWPLERLVQRLAEVGYSRHEPVEMVGQFAVRGGIVDVFVPGADYPCRLQLFGDTVESLREFDPRTQQSIRPRAQVEVLPMQEYPAGGSGLGLLPPGWEFSAIGPQWRSASLLELLPGAAVLAYQPQALEREAEAWWERLEESREQEAQPADAYYFGFEQFRDAARQRKLVILNDLDLGAEIFGQAEAAWHIRSRPVPRFEGDISHCLQEIRGQIAERSSVLVAASSLGDLERLADLFGEHEVPFQLVLRERPEGLSRHLEEKAGISDDVASAIIVKAAIPHGCLLPESGLSIYGTQDVFGSTESLPRPSPRKAASAAFLTDLEDLRVGDPVVHAQHGVGQYLGVQQVEAGGRSEDFLLLEYAQGARLYVPLTRLDLVHKYHGAGGPKPQLDRLGGQTWEKTKRRVKARLLDMADDLLKLYAKRELGRDFAYSPDSNWQREFEDSFLFEPTEDQLTATKEIKRDMESRRIMDRLVCGDVGFGKTEVAMRAAFKALGDDKQVAVLVPTTVLAYQHLETFRQRFAAFPVEIEMLSRFRTPKEIRSTLRQLREGTVDIVIGTHRLLSADVEFRDLGLLIIDEEQRFGVRHKERLKQVRQSVDVLAMTATPIPRTLYMSLMGLRDVSVIKTPPQDRLAIQTVVAKYDERMVTTAIRREVRRGGQVYFLHNRVESIQARADRLAAALPDVRFRVGHGQMAERELERVMLGFMRHDFDVLVATTIVENGLDIALANTIIVDRADLYGLAELYQLRGRVGRSNRRAYAYLLVPPERELSDVARKRLAALREFSELGAGFKMAALDMELRGAGNLLGGEQSGQVAAVGFETYTQLLEESVRKLRGEQVEDVVRTQVKLRLDFHIPASYVPEETQRLQLYKRLAAVRDDAERDRAVAELRDRYGPLPPAVDNLLAHALLKHRAEAMRIPSIERTGDRLVIKLREDSKVSAERLMRIVAATKGVRFEPDGTLEWPGFEGGGTVTFSRARRLLEDIAAQESN